jgi:hypothetical protein
VLSLLKDREIGWKERNLEQTRLQERISVLSNRWLQNRTYSVTNTNTVRSESHCALRLQYVDLVVSIEVAVEVAVVSVYSVVKQWLKCNTVKVCNCLIQFLLTMVLSIEECGFLVHSNFLKAL